MATKKTPAPKAAKTEKKSTPAQDSAAKKKADKAALAAGAKEIKKAAAEAAKAGKAIPGKPEVPTTAPAFELVSKGEQMMVTVIASERSFEDIFAEHIKVRPSGVGLEISETITPEEWVVAAQHFGKMSEHIGFYVGDLLRHAELKFGDKYAAAVAATGLKLKTLQNYTTTSGKVAPETRVPALGFSHHAEVNALTPAKQRDVLAKAAKHGWTVAKTREEVKKLQGTTRKTRTPAASSIPAATPAGSGTSTPVTQSEEEMNAATAAENAAADTAAAGSKDPATDPADSQGTPPAAKTAAPARKLTPEELEVNSTHLDMSDTLETFFRGSLFKALPAENKAQWCRALKVYAATYESLLAEGYGK